ncbi:MULTISPECIES: hypothetical protein [Halorussus]|uniref:hypothetical protein n=1 Tax=Halorussus TaxID=1070314 RepID=UPI001F03C69A|nr:MULTISPECIES: hypothetical protein [Halorussus]
MSDRDAGRSASRGETADESARDVPDDGDTARSDPETARSDAAIGRTAPDDPPGRDPDEGGDGDDGAGLTGAAAVVVAAVIGLGVTALTYLWVDGFFGGEVFYERLFRVAPTVSGGGVGSDWVFGNTVPVLDAAIAIVHAADVIMGVFILGMVFVHWAIFRRLAQRMRPPTGREAGDAVATDGGRGASGTDAGDPPGDGGERNAVSRTSEAERNESSGRERGGDGR